MMISEHFLLQRPFRHFQYKIAVEIGKEYTEQLRVRNTHTHTHTYTHTHTEEEKQVC